MRVLSLVPSATETLLAWGVVPIAVTRFCEQGDRFVTVGGTKDPSVADIVAMRPDVVVMCDQENRREDADALTSAGVSVHAVHIVDIATVGDQMSLLAEAVGLDRSLGEACAAVPMELPTGGRRVFAPIWRKPWMTINGDTYGGSLLTSLGLDNIFSAHTDRYPTVTEDEIRVANPDQVWATSEPYPFTERQRDELEVFAPTVFVDGKDVFWWGVRTPQATARLRALLS
jgi:ABC-type Fe3+-hydroxamate transport system substrate-binding protein